MKKILQAILNSLFKIVAPLSLIVASPSIFTPNQYNFKDNIIKDYAPYIHALTFPDGERFCSSSAVSYKGKVYSVTNNHCCDVPIGLDDHQIVGGLLEEIIFRSPTHDVCVLTSSQIESPIILGKKEFEVFDEVLLFGYPRGENLTPRFGHVLSLNQIVTIGYESGDMSLPANFVSTISYGGNSGSPIFNSKGELINLLFAGSPMVVTYGITIPLIHIQMALENAYRLDVSK